MLIKIGMLGRLGGISGIPGFGVFNLNFLSLSDTHGNTGTFTRAGAANAPDWQGVLKSIPVDTQRVNHGRWDGTNWFGDDGAGNPLHPTEVINGELTRLDLTDYATGQTVAAGGRRAFGGRYYLTPAGGTTSGASPLVDIGVTDWVDVGIYNPGYGQLLETGGTNKNINYNANPDVALTGLTLNDLGTGATLTRVLDTTELTNAGLSSLCSSGYAFRLLSGTAGAQVLLDGLVGNLNPHSWSVHIRVASGSGKVNMTGGLAAVSGITNPTYQRIKSENFTPGAPNDILIMQAEVTNSDVYFILNQLEESPVVTSEIITLGAAGVRQNELGNLKFSTNTGWGGANAFPHAAGSLFFSGAPQHDLSQHGNTINSVVGTNNTSWQTILRQDASGSIASRTMTAYVGVAQTIAYLRNQATQYLVEWDDGVKSGTGVSHFRVGYRVASTGMAWVWSAYATYDGAFNDTGFLQFFADTVGALPWSVRNTIIHNKVLTTQEENAYVID